MKLFTTPNKNCSIDTEVAADRVRHTVNDVVRRREAAREVQVAPEAVLILGKLFPILGYSADPLSSLIKVLPYDP